MVKKRWFLKFIPTDILCTSAIYKQQENYLKGMISQAATESHLCK
jgi:hypothetical protein